MCKLGIDLLILKDKRNYGSRLQEIRSREHT